VVATAVVVVLAAGSEAEAREAAPVPGSNGMVISTLRLAP
jgi:hypothetical protein